MARILIVEDESTHRFILDQVLRRNGHEVRAVATAGEAVAAIGFRPDLAILDWGLPDRNGDEVARRLRRSSPKLPVVFMTGYPLEYVRHTLESDAPMLALQKPFELRDLMEAIERLLGEKNGRTATAAHARQRLSPAWASVGSWLAFFLGTTADAMVP